MTTYAPEAHTHRPHINLWLIAVVGLAAALVALGSWALVDRFAGGSGATQNATTLLDKWYAAASTSDVEAATALWASNGVLWMNDSKLVGAQAIVSDIGVPQGLKIERTAPVTVDGDFATTFVRFSAATAGIKEWPVVDVYRLKDGKIFRQWSFVLGETPPFDNTAVP